MGSKLLDSWDSPSFGTRLFVCLRPSYQHAAPRGANLSRAFHVTESGPAVSGVSIAQSDTMRAWRVTR